MARTFDQLTEDIRKRYEDVLKRLKEITAGILYLFGVDGSSLVDLAAQKEAEEAGEAVWGLQ